MNNHTTRQPKRKRLALLIGLTSIGILGASACASPTVTETAQGTTTTITTPPPTAASYSPSFPAYTSPPPSPDPVEVVVANPEAKACGIIRRAQQLPTYSGRWDSLLYDAEDAAHSDALYTLIDNASNAIFDTPGYNYDAVAEHLLEKAVAKFC